MLLACHRGLLACGLALASCFVLMAHHTRLVPCGLALACGLARMVLQTDGRRVLSCGSVLSVDDHGFAQEVCQSRLACALVSASRVYACMSQYRAYYRHA